MAMIDYQAVIKRDGKELKMNWRFGNMPEDADEEKASAEWKKFYPADEIISVKRVGSAPASANTLDGLVTPPASQ